ncbi:MAG: phosphate ABC transporter permease PstA [Microthrixaceae bacterium]
MSTTGLPTVATRRARRQRQTTDLAPLKSTLSLRRRSRNLGASLWMTLSFLVAAVPLAFVLIVVVAKGWRMVISTHWWTHSIPTNLAMASLAGKADVFGSDVPARVVDVVYGMRPAIIGTLIITSLASLLAIPLGVAGAVYLNEYGGRSRPASVIRFLSDIMTGVPSVVMGIFVYTVWVLRFGTSGRSAFAGALSLACLMLPVVVRSTEEMLRLVPDSLRHASAALGTPRWKTVVKVVLPAALPGITSGSMLAVARAAGETAPILFTVGAVTRTNWSPFGANTALSSQIYSNATQPGGEAMAWGAALTLIAVVMVLTLAARFVTSRFAVRVDE